ncbi:hypothetical protein [Brevundimonas lutea]|uniref:hypothetical protein n=1 Tax=Brevundimonas lutea TaxID=2293980 RepID=UPI000F029ED5|nr:hypothetical protein [Brevundimonas lutea]
MPDDAARDLADRLIRSRRPDGVRTALLHAGRDGAKVLMHQDVRSGARLVDKRIGRLAAARHASGEAFFHRHVAGHLSDGLLSPYVHCVQDNVWGARLLLDYIDHSHWNLFRQAGELAAAVATSEAEMSARLAELQPRHAARLALMSPLRRPARTRPRGGWPKRLGFVARLAAEHGLTGPDARRRWTTGLSRLERGLVDLPMTFANCDLIKPNLRFTGNRFVALDWGAAAVMPRGHDIGVLLAALLRYDDRFVFRHCEARAREAAALSGDREAAARYGFLIHALDHLAGPLFAEGIANPARRDLALDKLGIVVARLDAVGD